MREYKKNLRTITTTQAAEMLGVTTSCVRAMIGDGRLAAVQPRFRAHMLVDLAATQELAAERQRIVAMRLEQRAKQTRYTTTHGLDTTSDTAPQPTPPPPVVPVLAKPGPASIIKRLDRIEVLLQRLADAWDL